MTIGQLKEIQKEIIRKNKKCNIITSIVLCFVIVLTIFIKSKYGFINNAFVLALIIETISIILISFIIKMCVNGKDIAKFNEGFKKLFVNDALKSTFDDLEYNMDEGFSKTIIDQYSMLDTGDSFSSNDYISGKYKGINFEQSDLFIEEKRVTTDSDGDTEVEWIPIFTGRYMIFDFNKIFKANVQVVSKNFYSHLFPWGKKYSTVKMEDAEFNKLFKVYTSMEHDAFYLLTPHFIDKIKTLYKQLNANIMLGFLDNRLHIAIDNGKDSFEYNVFKPINEKEIKDNIIKDIKLITDFVDEFNLDNDLFKKEN
ncbi:MAG: DUF3137 domain-containing protein [Bacilli bacterium]|nr:DUF3137 domain-containing protein [Bacilli bacterium]